MVSARSETGMMATRYYYALGRSTGYAINGTRQTTIAYDSFGRIATMSVPTGQSNNPNNRTIEQFSWAYLPGSDLKASLQYPNGLTASWTYDANNQLLQVRNATPTNVISQFDYTYDAAGRRVSIAKSGTAFGDLSGSIDSYTYNARSELTSARRTKNGQPIPGFSEDFDYDPIGNRRSSSTYNEKGEAQTSTYAANNLNQYTQRTTPGYAAVRGEADPNAMVTVNENPTFRLGSYYFGSDLFDNTASSGLANLETYATLAQTAANGEEADDLISAETNQVYIAQSSETFVYDDDGNQTLITTKTGLWRVTYNGENRPILWVRDSDNVTLTMTYDHMGRRREKNAQRFFYDGYLQVVDNIGNAYTWDCTESVATRPLSWLCDDSVACYVHDGNKNVREVVAVDGSHVAHYGYAPFGTVTISSGSSAALNPWRFSSEYADDELGCDYYNYREYEPVSGRWTSRDFVEGGGLAVYGFCENGPCCRIDYIGLYRLSLITNETTEDDALLWFISREMQKNPYHEIRTGMSSVEEVLKAMEDSVSKHAEKITQLDLSGHGFSDAVGVQFKRSGFIVEELTADQKQRIKACMASNARIVFWSCQTASTEEQKGTLQAFANEMEIRIKAKDGYVRSGPDGDFVDYLVDVVAYLIVKGELGGGWKEFRPTQKEIPCKEDGPKAYLISKKE